MNETNEDNKIEPLPVPTTNIVVIEDSIASRTKEITKRPKRERSPSKTFKFIRVFSTFLLPYFQLYKIHHQHQK